MRVMLSEIDFERFVSKITEANNKKEEGEGGKRGGTIDEFDLSLRIFFNERRSFLFLYLFFFYCYSFQENYIYSWQSMMNDELQFYRWKYMSKYINN